MQVNPWLVVALVGGLVGAGQLRAATTEETTVEVVTKRTLISAPPAPGVGLGFVSGGDLFDPDGSTRIGEGYSHCGVVAVSTAVPPEVTAHCTSTFRLPDGELHLSGMRKYKSIAAGFEETPVAVVGGTGAYADSRGEGRVVRAGNEGVGYRFTLTVVTG